MIKYFGDLSYRGLCPKETAEHMTFVSHVNNNYPDLPLVHVKNEGVRTWRQAAFDKAMGSIRKGAPDIIILHKVPFILEIKRRNSAVSEVSAEQIEFLENCSQLGCYACVAYGYEAAIESLQEWLSYVKSL